MTKYIITNEIKTPIIKLIGLGANSGKILWMHAKGLLKLGAYCSGRIKKEIKDIGIW